VEWIGVQPDVDLEVYTGNFAHGKGRGHFVLCFWFQIIKLIVSVRERSFPSFSRLAFADSEDRIWLPEPNATAQVERAIFEFKKKRALYLQRHADERVRRCTEQHLVDSMHTGRDKMLHFLLRSGVGRREVGHRCRRQRRECGPFGDQYRGYETIRGTNCRTQEIR